MMGFLGISGLAGEQASEGNLKGMDSLDWIGVLGETCILGCVQVTVSAKKFFAALNKLLQKYRAIVQAISHFVEAFP